MDLMLPDIHYQLFEGAARILQPYIYPEQPVESPLSEDSVQLIQRASSILNRVIEINPENWNAYWLLGYSYLLIEDLLKAYDSFKIAWSMESSMIEIITPYADVCLRLGKGDEAVELCRKAMELYPNHAGLITNYALSLMIAGDLMAAQEAIELSLNIDPSDQITRYFQNLLESIRMGHQPRPLKWPPD